MSIEKQNKPSARDLETHHFDQDPSGGINVEFFKDNEHAFKIAKELLYIKQAKLIIEIDSVDLTKALIKNSAGKIIFETDLPFEIEELAGIAYNTAR